MAFLFVLDVTASFYLNYKKAFELVLTVDNTKDTKNTIIHTKNKKYFIFIENTDPSKKLQRQYIFLNYRRCSVPVPSSKCLWGNFTLSPFLQEPIWGENSKVETGLNRETVKVEVVNWSIQVMNIFKKVFPFVILCNSSKVYSKSSVTNSTPINTLVSVDKGYEVTTAEQFFWPLI